MRLAPVVWRAFFGWLALSNAASPAQEFERPEPAEEYGSPQARTSPPRGSNLVLNEFLTPHWIHGGPKFWYRRELSAMGREFLLVDPAAGKAAPAFDHRNVATALAKATGKDVAPDHLPFDRIGFDPKDSAVLFAFGLKGWHWDLRTEVLDEISPRMIPDEPSQPPVPQRGRRRGGSGDVGGDSRKSPDGKWTARIHEHDVEIQAEGASRFESLTDDGKPDDRYARIAWSPDSKSFVVFKIRPGEDKVVHLIESSPQGGGRAKLTSRPYPLPGDRFDSFTPVLFRLGADGKAWNDVRPKVEPIDFGFPIARWSADGSAFTYEKVDRGHQRFRLIEVRASDGETRSVIDERSKTFIWTAHTENLGVRLVTWLGNGKELIYSSEKCGWRHIYLVDVVSGAMKPITQGEYVVRGVDRIDEDKRQVWFHASGKVPGQDPYFLHYYRVNLDGSGLVALTEGDGSHTVHYSPDGAFLIDSHSRVDSPPAHELRRTADGSLVTKLEAADISALKKTDWQAPEVFVAKGRDGKTDIWGIITRPKDFDPNRKYPVIEHIYAGPQGSFVPKTFSRFRRFAALNDLGFVVVQTDGMGTANRSKAFHDICWHNLKDGGFPDRILWHKAVAAKYPWYDASKVGLYGGSAGGQNAAAGVLFHPDFYKIAVAGCGCHDNRMDKASWNEQWMGYPVGEWYSESSNIDNAGKLKGQLLLIVGELDSNVPPESTYRFVDALIRAGKDFEFVLVPGANHGMGGPFGDRKLRDFFVKHLQGKEPSDRNVRGR